MLPVLLAILFVSTLAESVTVQVRNEFSDALAFKSANLEKGTWVTPPPKEIDAANTYNTVWKASGATGVAGHVIYTAGGGRAVVTFQFTNVGGNQTATVTVTPPPWIGGLGTKTGTVDVTFQYWLHKMCMTTTACKL